MDAGPSGRAMAAGPELPSYTRAGRRRRGGGRRRKRTLVLRALAFAGGVWAAKRWGGEAGFFVGEGGPAPDLGGRAWAAAAGEPPAFAPGGDGQAWHAGGGRELLAVAAKQYEPAAWEKEPTGVMAYLLGIVYLFLGIAIVCDDYFVASLEVISERLNLSEDVAGATFMAAGSSAPELFSSLMSLLSANAKNETGVGTVIGSAIFNILVIVGVTGVMAGQDLELDWKPILRDLVFYTVAIGSTAGIFADGVVHWWEGLISVLMYLSYILFMVYNKRIFDWVEGHSERKRMRAGAPAPAAEVEANGKARHPSEGDAADGRMTPTKHFLAENGDKDVEAGAAGDGKAGGEKLVKLQLGKKSNRRSISFNLRGVPAEDLAVFVSKGELEKAQDDFGKNGASVLYTQKMQRSNTTLSAGRRRSIVGRRSIVDVKQVDFGEEGLVDKVLTKSYTMMATVSKTEVEEFEAEEKVARIERSHPSFAKHPKDTSDVAMAVATQRAGEQGGDGAPAAPAEGAGDEEDEEDDDEGGSPFAPPDEAKDYPLWLLSLPWNALMYVTIPKCESEAMEKFFLLTCLMSIAWIVAITYFMVDWAARLGAVLGVPQILMGLVVLAAGTSIPDALSSIVVAQQGMGDMAVANAIGSNIFDIWLGLGLPWLCVLPFEGGKVNVSTDSLLLNIGIMFFVLLVYASAIMYSNWRLTRRTGVFLIGMYALYAVYNIAFVWQLKLVKSD